jgi:hypothetical protein
LISGDKSQTSTPSSRSSMVANCSSDGSFIFLIPPVKTDPVTCSPIFEDKVRICRRIVTQKRNVIHLFHGRKPALCCT